VVARARAIDTGAIDTGAIDTGAIDTGAIDTVVPDTGATEARVGYALRTGGSGIGHGGYGGRREACATSVHSACRGPLLGVFRR
jgi:hypothetical protein